MGLCCIWSRGVGTKNEKEPPLSRIWREGVTAWGRLAFGARDGGVNTKNPLRLVFGVREGEGGWGHGPVSQGRSKGGVVGVVTQPSISHLERGRGGGDKTALRLMFGAR